MNNRQGSNHDGYWEKLQWLTSILKRYAEGKLNPEEERIVEKWNPHKLIAPLHEIQISKSQVEKHGEKVRQKVLLEYKMNSKNTKKRLTFSRHVPKYAAVAAMVIIALGIYYITLIDNYSGAKNSYTESLRNRTNILQTSTSETKQIVLPDGTKLYANGDTRIDYDRDQFNREKREIWLSGEAFFEVAKNPDKPFIIHTGNIRTIVRGTSFNVKAYRAIGKISVSVRTGKVEVGTDRETFGLLTHNKQLVFNEKTKEHSISENNWEDAGAWMHKRLVLADANYDELKIRLKQLYGITLMDERGLLRRSLLNASYRQGVNVDDILRGISEVYGIGYDFDQENKIVSLYEIGQRKK
jgi:ferric-dicitrate binding protein FerR (iron transport regulator)